MQNRSRRTPNLEAWCNHGAIRYHRSFISFSDIVHLLDSIRFSTCRVQLRNPVPTSTNCCVCKYGHCSTHIIKDARDMDLTELLRLCVILFFQQLRCEIRARLRNTHTAACHHDQSREPKNTTACIERPRFFFR